MLNHNEGQDVEAKAGPGKDDCSEWTLALYPADRSGKLNWKGSAGCEVDAGEAVLVGDE